MLPVRLMFVLLVSQIWNLNDNFLNLKSIGKIKFFAIKHILSTMTELYQVLYNPLKPSIQILCSQNTLRY